MGLKAPIFRLWDGMDGTWVDVSDAVSEAEAKRIWNEKTKNGTMRVSFMEIDYYSLPKN
jgi:hypothetical protein